MRPEELNEFFRPLLACVVLRGLAAAPLEALLLQRPLFWNVSFENLEPADLFDGFNAIRIVCVADEKPVLDAHCDYGAYVGCSFGLRKVFVEVDQKSMTPRCSGLAAVQMRNRLDFGQLRAKISGSAASSFAYADG